tara:strand:- start:579 stop:839 length:261 start_codon:yes stop_codon:yes gene_type:complete
MKMHDNHLIYIGLNIQLWVYGAHEGQLNKKFTEKGIFKSCVAQSILNNITFDQDCISIDCYNVRSRKKEYLDAISNAIESSKRSNY